MAPLIALLVLVMRGGQPHYSKRALLVGAWDYRSQLWHNLSSDHDVALIKSTLQTHFSWTEDKGGKIVVLTKREETTRESILSHFRQFLATDVREGDTIYFHYSGHGYQAPDSDPAKDPALKLVAPVNPLIGNSLSGLDQTLLPTDNPDKNANQIRNDELGLLVKGVFDAAKGKHINVLITLDACHSGGGTRGMDRIVRGRLYDGPIPNVVPTYDPASPNAVFLNRVRGYTFLSACRPDQEAGEALGPDRRSYGRFTLALCDALAKSSSATTYRQLFDQIDETMSSRWTFGAIDVFSQNPQMEGEGTRSVFGASAIPSSPYLTLLPIGRKAYRLKGGALQGITPGSILKLYRTSDSAHPIATLTATQVGIVDSGFTSIPRVADIPTDKLTGARAILVSQGPSSPEPRIDLSAIKSSSQFAEIKAVVLTEIPSAQVSQIPDPKAVLKVDLAAGGTGFRIFRMNTGAEVTADAFGVSEPITDSAPEAIADRLFEELRYTAVAQMKNDFPGQIRSVELQIVPCEARGPLDAKTWVRDLPGNLSMWPVETFFTLKIRITGNWEPYVTVLDLTSDGKVTVLWPSSRNTGSAVQMHRIFVKGKPDSGWHRLISPISGGAEVFHTTLPEGKEIIKLVASERPLPFRELLESTRGSQAHLTPLGRLFQQYSTVTRRSQADSTDPGEIWSTREVVITVGKPKD